MLPSVIYLAFGDDPIWRASYFIFSVVDFLTDRWSDRGGRAGNLNFEVVVHSFVFCLFSSSTRRV